MSLSFETKLGKKNLNFFIEFWLNVPTIDQKVFKI